MSSRGANVTVTIGAAFAGSFKSVFREADRELKNFGKRATRTPRTADRAAAGLGKSVAGIERAAVGAHKAVGATVKEMHGMKAVASHTRAAAREVQSVARGHREATKAARAYTRETIRGARAEVRAQARAARSVHPVSLAAPGSAAGLQPAGSRRTRSGVPAVSRRALPNAGPWGAPPPRLPRGGGRQRPGAFAGALGGPPGGGRRGGGARHGGGGHGGMHSHDAAAIGGAVAGAVSAHTVWDAVKSAGELNDLQVLLKLQGRTASEIQEATNAAHRIAAKNPNISVVEAMKSVIDVADAGDRDMKKAARLAPVIAQSAKMVALVADGAMKKNLGEDQSRYMGRVLEDTGVATKSEPEINAYVGAVTAGTIATRGIFNPKELFQTAQKSGGLARGWSKEFVGEVMPALTMALGGSGAGDALYMYGKTFTKGQAQLSSAKALMDLGLINKRDLLYDGKKYLGIRPDAMPNAAEFRTNPYDAFRNTVVAAALKKAGITDIGAERAKFTAAHANDTDLAGLSEDDRKLKMNDKFRDHIDNTLQRQIDTFAKSKNLSKMVSDFVAQEHQIQVTRAQIRNQPKNATDIMTAENFTAQVDKLQSSFHTLMTALGGPEVGTAITAMDQIAGAMSKLAVAAASDPGATQKAVAGIAAVTAGIATLGTIALAGPVVGAMAALGPLGLAVGAVGAALAAWAVLDWDGFSESMGKLLAIGQALKSVLDFLGSIGDDAKGNSLIGRAVSAVLGNNDSSNSEAAYLDAAKRRDAAKARLDSFDPKARGAFPGQRAGLEDDLRRAEAEVKAQGDANVAHAEKQRKRQEREARAMKMLSDADQKVKDATDRANAVKAMQEHAEHSDAELTKRVQDYKWKAQDSGKRRRRPGQSDTFGEGGKPVSATNVAPIPGSTIAQPVPGSQGAPAVPGASLAQAGGTVRVEIAGPVKLTTPVLITTQGIVAVHDAELSSTMSGLQATLQGMAGSLTSIAANTAATVAACQAVVGAINAKQFTVNMPAGIGSAGASRERASFSD